MTDKKDPIEIFRTWYSEQPKEIQGTVAFFTLTRVPRLDTPEFDVLLHSRETIGKVKRNSTKV